MKAGSDTVKAVIEEAGINADSMDASVTNREQMEGFCEAHNIDVDAFCALLESIARAEEPMLWLASLAGEPQPKIAINNAFLQVGVRLGFRAAKLEREEDR